MKGISDKTFSPEDAITGEQLAVILMNYAKNKGYDVKSRADLSKYEDSKDISNWAINELSWANAIGLNRR